MLGLVITLAGQQLITLPAALAVMLGAEIGTCADTLLASLGRSVAAMRAGLFHLAFNLTTAVLGLLLLHPLGIAAGLLPGGDQLPRQIANAHTLFNVAGVVLFLPFTAPIAALLNRVLPDRHERDASASISDSAGPATVPDGAYRRASGD
jgi:phosphate:Na+ symporter